MKHSYRRNRRRGTAYLLAAMILLPLLGAPLQMALATEGGADSGTLKRSGIELKNNDIVLQSDTLTWEQSVIFDSNTTQTIDLPTGLLTTGADAILFRPDSSDLYKISVDIAATKITVAKPADTGAVANMLPVQYVQPEDNEPEPETPAPEPSEPEVPEVSEPEQSEPQQPELVPQPEEPEETAPQTSPQIDPEIQEEPTAPSEPEPAPDPEQPETPEEPAAGIDPEALFSAAFFSLVPHAAAAGDSYTLSVPCKIDINQVNENDDMITISGVQLKALRDAPIGSTLSEPEITLHKMQQDGKYAESPIKENEKVSLSDTLYLKLFWEDLGGVKTDTPYTFRMPDALKSVTAIDKSPVYLEGQDNVIAAYLSIAQGTSLLTIQFEEVKGKVTDSTDTATEDLHEFEVGFGCNFAEDQLDHNDQGVVEIKLPGGKTVAIVTVTDYQPKGPELEKKASKVANDGTVTWTLTYTTATDTYTTEKPPAQLIDALPAHMEYVPDTFSAKKGDAQESSITASKNADGNKLEIELPENLTTGTYIITYQTRLSTEGLFKIWSAPNATFNYKNTVSAKDADGKTLSLKASASTTLPTAWDGRTLMSKNGTLTKATDGTDTYVINWDITVNTVAQSFVQLGVKDTLGKGLKLQTDTIRVNGEEVNVTATSSDTITVVQTTDTDKDITTLDFQLVPQQADGNSKAAKEIYKITYTTTVDPCYFMNDPDHLLTDNDVENKAELYWIWPTGISGTPPTPPTITKGPGTVAGLDNDLLYKAGAGYRASTRALEWQVTINPHKVNLNSMTLTEDLQAANPAHSFTREKSGNETIGLPLINDTVAAQTIQTAIETSMRAQGISGTATVTVTDGKKLTITLPNIGKESFAFTYNTYVDDAAIWANHVPIESGDRLFENTVTPSEVQVDSKMVTIDAVTAKQYARVDLLQKKAIAYEPELKEITWVQTLNLNNVPLTNVKIEDELPVGLTYVQGSAKFGDNSVDGVTQTGQVVTFPLGSFKAYKALTYRTTIDTDQLAVFTSDASVTLKNSAKLISDEYNGMSPVSADFTIANKPLDKQTPGPDSNRKVKYTVRLNPLGVKLLDEGQTALSLRDKLADGLCLDEDSVEVYEGNPTASVTAGNCNVTLNKAQPINNVSITYNPTENTLMIPIPEDGKPYYITYEAYVTRANVNLNNAVTLTGSKLPEKEGFESASYDVTFTAHGSVKYSLPKDKFFSISVQKADADGKTLPVEAKFGLYTDSACNDLLMEKTTEKQSGICIFGLSKRDAQAYGTLYLKETQAPENYQVSQSILPINVEQAIQDGKNPYELTIKNFPNTAKPEAKIVLKKVDNDNIALADVQFGLYRDPAANTVAVETGTTGADGTLIFTGLYPEIYYVKELQTPDTHVPNDTIYSVEAGKNATFNITNAKAEAVIRITKVREDNPNIKLPGAKFKLFANEKGTVQKGDELETDENGVVEFKGLRPNTIYYLRETVVPSGYENQDELLNKLIKIETGENNANLPVEITVSNKKILVSIKVVKVREGREATKLEGAKFALYESDKQTIAGSEKATDSNGELIFVNLEPQTTYYVKETVTPTGYKTPQNVWTEVKTKDFTDLVPKELKITNEKILVSLHVIKKGDGAAGPRLPGAKLALYEADKTTLVHAAQTTDANGETTFTNLEPETTYYIRETEAPKGYRIKNEWTEVKTGAFDAAKPAATTVVNEKILVGIRVIKVREGDPDTKLEGAKFELYSDTEGKSLLRAAQATDANGVTEFLNLQPETVYYLKETEAPSGYRILTDGLIEIKTGEGAEGAQPVEQVVENARRRSSSSSRPKPPAEEPETPVVPVGPTDPVNPADPTGPDQPAKPDDPTNPDNPQDAGDPSKPGGSDDPANPDKPGDPSKGDGTVTVPSESTPGGAFGTASSGNRVSSIPETGVRDRIPLWALGLACSLGLAAVLCLSQLIFRPKGKHMKKRG